MSKWPKFTHFKPIDVGPFVTQLQRGFAQKQYWIYKQLGIDRKRFTDSEGCHYDFRRSGNIMRCFITAPGGVPSVEIEVYANGLSLAFKTDKTKFLIYDKAKETFIEVTIKRVDDTNLVNLDYPHSWDDRAINNPTAVIQGQMVFPVARTRYYGNDGGDRNVLFNNDMVSYTYSTTDAAFAAEFDPDLMYRQVYQMYNSVSVANMATMGMFMIDPPTAISDKHKEQVGYLLTFDGTQVALYKAVLPSVADLENSILSDFPTDPLFRQTISYNVPSGFTGVDSNWTFADFFVSFPIDNGNKIIYNSTAIGLGEESGTPDELNASFMLSMLREDAGNPSLITGFDVQQIMDTHPSDYNDPVDYTKTVGSYTETVLARCWYEWDENTTYEMPWSGSASFIDSVASGSYAEGECDTSEENNTCHCDLVWRNNAGALSASFTRSKIFSTKNNSNIPNRTNDLGCVPFGNSYVKVSYETSYSNGDYTTNSNETLEFNAPAESILLATCNPGDDVPVAEGGCGDIADPPCSGPSGSISVYGPATITTFTHTGNISGSVTDNVTKNFLIDDVIKFVLFSQTTVESGSASSSSSGPVNTNDERTVNTTANGSCNITMISRHILYMNVDKDYYIIEKQTVISSNSYNNSASSYSGISGVGATAESNISEQTVINWTHAIEIHDKGVITTVYSNSYNDTKEEYEGMYFGRFAAPGAPDLNPWFPCHYWRPAEYDYVNGVGSGSITVLPTSEINYVDTVYTVGYYGNLKESGLNIWNAINPPNYIEYTLYSAFDNFYHSMYFNFTSDVFATFHVSEFNGDVIFLYEFIPFTSPDENNPPKGIWFNGISVDLILGDPAKGIPPFDDIYFSFVT